eukprot:CAMPEP_0172376894 /NCGR_PEP_ID=MMETSP1060-20121228/68623_1 /TAXON_ID=37318 /ORGANISM="Pseudo-nitzschia pungens, Strain cf. cingulata" /LENGTH=480 /DNA_ID=CAMNT_0013104559 /DNA_START=61 /DNA_END=1500 /DNA_ORIENTATION=+
MATTTPTDIVFGGCNCSGGCCVRERERLQTAHKRLDLQMQRFALDQEMFEAERKIFKKNAKLAAKSKSMTEEDRARKAELEYQVQTLLDQIQKFRQTEKQWKSRDREQTKRIAEAEVAVAECSEEHELRIRELERDLRDRTANTSDTQLELEHEIEALQNQVEEYRQKEEQWKDREIEHSESVAVAEAAVLNRKILELEEDLREVKANFTVSTKTHAKEKEQWENEKLEMARCESIDSTKSASSEEGIVRLEQEWRQEKTKLEAQLRNQNEQIENWKLLLPRNKVLLEQSQSKNERLEKDLVEIRSRSGEQASRIDELERQLKTLQQIQEDLITQEEVENDMNTVISENGSDATAQSHDLSPSFSILAKTIVIPSDINPDELKTLEKKFVVERKWTNSQAGFKGNYTGWLDLTGNPNGYGTLRHRDGGIYTGEWKDGLRNGFGVNFFVDGALYSGPWLNDRFQGRGFYVSENNHIYMGDW